MNVDIPKITAHKKYILDIQWNPYDDNMIATCSEDGCVRIWEIPPQGVHRNWNDGKALVTLDYHERRCNQVLTISYTSYTAYFQKKYGFMIVHYNESKMEIIHQG